MLRTVPYKAEMTVLRMPRDYTSSDSKNILIVRSHSLHIFQQCFVDVVVGRQYCCRSTMSKVVSVVFDVFLLSNQKYSSKFEHQSLQNQKPSILILDAIKVKDLELSFHFSELGFGWISKYAARYQYEPNDGSRYEISRWNDWWSSIINHTVGA